MKAEYVTHTGDDLFVVNVARHSFSKTSEEFNDKDQRLIYYLAKHGHWSPFSHCNITLRMKAPVPIRTQCFKHKVGFAENEESRRYISSTPELFIPEYFRNAPPEGQNKQGSIGKHHRNDHWLNMYTARANDCMWTYISMIEDGVCPEQARFILPQGVMVNWIWTGSLMAYARFYNQRSDPHAQLEIQDLASQVGQIIEPLFPVSWRALTT